MTLDYDRYLPHLEHHDISEDQKRDLIAVVYGFMEGFVDVAFGVHPVQACLSSADRISKQGGRIVELSNENLTIKFERVALSRQKDQR
jgi:hypothetical protein